VNGRHVALVAQVRRWLRSMTATASGAFNLRLRVDFIPDAVEIDR
jgi:hypothetical protein